MPKPSARTALSLIAALVLSACSLVKYQPVETISTINTSQGYRFGNQHADWSKDDTLVVLMFSGGGTRAAALGYGVLEQLNRHKVHIGGKQKSLLEHIDIVVGVSGGSVLAAYYSLHGTDTIPSFYKRFLRQNFQRMVIKQAFSAANIPRLASPEYGRGDLLQEQFENQLFGNATFEVLEKHRKGPFAIITATDMGISEQLKFTQEDFDVMCINLNDVSIARAVASSSAVPLVFAPLTFNNNGGNCGYTLPPEIAESLSGSADNKQQSKTHREIIKRYEQYNDSRKRPYIHLLDGGLTDNLGMRVLLDIADIDSGIMLDKLRQNGVRHIVAINVNAQNEISKDIDQSAAVPGFSSVMSAVVDIPIDRFSQHTLRGFRSFADKWNEEQNRLPPNERINLSFVSLNLRDLPKSELRDKVLNIPTSFYLPPQDVDNLRTAAAELLKHSKEYQTILKKLSARPNTEARFAEFADGNDDEMLSAKPETTEQ
ncbi:patatin-like phospholipase family protein [Neisseria animalis]|uniref:Patatin-like phospholipase family protein n=1 Tax=Neisseria animalis TaxID=492 RepID=A0A5P3MNR2_NEIAN|nr:patatin-like phospholipase family protein [Neisseria animalis]QEY23183.1 patatin-like phospholipase family protein [Neisseria animalis]ROW32512.1 patatin-like phospholipase family protein [Neisseria animalis]VEE08321.1 Patatin [Neisseria animalis]